MSPRAAWELESLGFAQVFDYVPGKTDWFASGVPVGELAKRMRERGMPNVLVTTSDGRLAGLLCREEAERLAGQRP